MQDSELEPVLDKRRLQPEDWSPLLIAMEDLLYNSSGLLNFSNLDVRSAVMNRSGQLAPFPFLHVLLASSLGSRDSRFDPQHATRHTRYLPTESDKARLHGELATFFGALDDNSERKVEEWPYHLEGAGLYRELQECLTNLALFNKLYTPSHKFDLFKYWRYSSPSHNPPQSSPPIPPVTTSWLECDVYVSIGRAFTFPGCSRGSRGVVLASWQHAGKEHLLRRGGLVQGGPQQAQRTFVTHAVVPFHVLFRWLTPLTWAGGCGAWCVVRG